MSRRSDTVLTTDDETKIYRIVAKAINDLVPPMINHAINNAFDTHPRLARMEKRDARMQRDINYLVEGVDSVDRKQRVTAKDLYLRTKRLEGPA